MKCLNRKKRGLLFCRAGNSARPYIAGDAFFGPMTKRNPKTTAKVLVTVRKEDSCSQMSIADMEEAHSI